MGQAQPKSSATDRYARRIAAAIGKGRPPPFSNDLEQYCSNSPHEIFAAFAGVMRSMPPAGKDEALAIGYLFVLQRLLEHLRYRTDRGYADAAKLIADFQAEVAAHADAGDIDGRMLAFVIGTLQQSKIPASPQLAAASAKHLGEQKDGAIPADVHAALAGILEACDDDSFMVVESLIETGHAIPVETRVALVGALAAVPQARSAAVLFLLDPDSSVRRGIARSLAPVANSLAPTDLRRLIAMRNWRPEKERGDIDEAIRRARAAGIDCAQWAPGSVESIFATAIDGSLAQGFLLISPAGRKKRMSPILTKCGIADASTGDPETPASIKAVVKASGLDLPTMPASRAYLDRVVAHHLALSTEEGKAIPLGLLQVAETIGGADWQPVRMDFKQTLAALLSELPKEMLEPAEVALVLRRSNELADLEVIEESWFEDDPKTVQAVEHAHGNRAKLANYLLQSVIARGREKWADLTLRTALWMREAPAEANLCWRELAIVAKALADGRDMTEIGLMRAIALRTIARAREDSPVWQL